MTGSNGRWHLYSRLTPKKNFEALLREAEKKVSARASYDKTVLEIEV